MSRFSRIWNPSGFQGAGITRRYFEGWYFKHVDAEKRTTIAVIPGVSYSDDGKTNHAFVQVVPSHGEAHYFAFPIDRFSVDPGSPFSIRIGENRFSRDGIVLDLHDADRHVTGELSYETWWPWPVTTLSPGIMGWYRFVPRMETYHGVLSMDHGLSGSLTVDGQRTDFSGGRGYVEKDWGRSFPSSWIWAQSNSFERTGVSVSLSVAKVPWMGGSFVGNIAGLLFDGRLHRFATYTGAKPTAVETRPNEARVTLADKHEELEVHVPGCEALILKAPVLGAMESRAAESLGGTIEVTLRTLRGGRAGIAFQGTGTCAGIEVMNDKDELVVDSGA